LLPGERGQVHSRFAEVIAADPALVMPGRAAAEQAWHWSAAHDAPRALVSAWQAAGQADRSLAYAEQLAMLSRVLELGEQVPDATGRTGADHVAVLEEAVRRDHRARAAALPAPAQPVVPVAAGRRHRAGPRRSARRG